MTDHDPDPGVSRANRISDEGLERLEKQLARGARISRPVLAQWIKRYGEPARNIIKKYDCYSAELD
ncbi:MAG: IS66 family transposase [Gammaproteobacteria bacterium]|nr:IS66 family transposase [Gammaproteobacteria bacterium]